MIMLYSGTPRSGKSLHIARNIRNWLTYGFPVICNFPIATDKIARKRAEFQYVPNLKLTPRMLIDYSNAYFKDKKFSISKKEGHIKIVIDEAQRIFNARDWGRQGRSDWLEFFTLHGHLGFDIILIAQFDRMLDRQIRALIEYEYIHRKMSNFGYKGKIITALALGELFIAVKVWYPMREKVGSECFRKHKKYYAIYDTHASIEEFDKSVPTNGSCSPAPSRLSLEDGGQGDPSDGDGSAGTAGALT